MTTYPVGTNIRDIAEFDRGTKVEFSCHHHPQYVYRSKDPFVSQLFPANEAAQDLYWGEKDECDHTLKDDVWFTTREYTS